MVMRRIRQAVMEQWLALAMLSVAACTSPTLYKPAVDGEGYGDQRLEPDRYRIWFAGNSVTLRQTVENYLLYRAAEVTLETGHSWFRITDQDTEADTTYITTAITFPSSAYAPFPYAYGPFGSAFLDARSRPVSRHKAFAVVALRTPVEDDHAYDAAAVLDSLGPTIIRPSTNTH